ncbi:MAG TPA: hypothetical protein VM689_07060 [Aliidongia sp.]|nr:hypothetical protein [Aliidongia sp.]
MGSAYENALADKEELQRQRSQIDERLSEIETFLRLHAKYEKKPERTSYSGSEQSVGPDTGKPSAEALSADSIDREKSHKGVTQKEFNNHLLDILVSADRPLPSIEIRKIYQEKGIQIGGTLPEKNFSSKMWQATKDGGFVRIQPGDLIWIRGHSYPSVGYIVEPDNQKQTGLDLNDAGLQERVPPEE